MKSNILELEKVSVGRDGGVLIPPFDYRLSGGDLLIVQGSNGSGKSSLLKSIAGLLPLISGQVRLNGISLYGSEIYPAQILYLGHKRGLSPRMSVSDNVTFWANAYGHPELTDVALHYFDLEDIADVSVQTLSAGWQQRVALTRLITIPGILWLLDEPTANLDTDGMGLLHSLLQVRLEQGGIVIMTTHAGVQGKNVRVLDLNSIVGTLQVEAA